MLSGRGYPKSMHRLRASCGEGDGVQRKQCLFSGRVQGVGFRYTCKNIALQHNVCGYVRNLSDGRVELVLEGPTDEMEQVVSAVNGKMDSYIQDVELKTLPATQEFDHFYIRH